MAKNVGQKNKKEIFGGLETSVGLIPLLIFLSHIFLSYSDCRTVIHGTMTTQSMTTVTAAPTEARQSRILIADDNAANVELLEVYLSEIDCAIEVAVDGRDTLDKVASFRPDLILLDIMMPKLSGFEVCEQVKGNPKTRGVMILMVTALDEPGDIERAVNAGTDDFLSKPVNKLELLKRVENMLRLRHVTDEVERLRRYIEGMEDSSGPQ